MPFDVYGVGNALVDIQAQVTDAVLHRIGYAKGIMTLVDEAAQQRVLAELGETPLAQCAGGSAANTIMGIIDLGGTAAYAGKVSRDRFGDFFLQDMRKLGVAIEVPQVEGQTGTSAILITEDAQRTMLTHLGVSSTLSADDIREDHVRAAKYIYIEGYLFATPGPRAAAERAIDIARASGVKVAFTVSDPFLADHCRELFWELIENSVDLVFCNLEEARALTGKLDPVECAHELHRHAENVALTMSEKGSLVMHGGEALPIESAPVHAIDTTGAGDMYAAGLLYGITNGLTWRQAGHLASQAAARVVTQLGARLKRPFTRNEIAALLR